MRMRFYNQHFLRYRIFLALAFFCYCNVIPIPASGMQSLLRRITGAKCSYSTPGLKAEIVTNNRIVVSLVSPNTK